MNKQILVLLTILITAALVFFLLPGDEKKIRHNLQLLAKYCSSPPDRNAIITIANIGKAVELCTESCTVDVESFSLKRTFRHKELSDRIVMMKKMLPDTVFSFHDTRINFPEKNRALITTTLSLRGKTKNQRFTDAYELDIAALHTEGDWLFSSFTVVEFMER